MGRAGLPNGSVTEVWVQSGDCGTAPEVPAEPEVPETPESSCSYSPGEIQNAEYVDFSITSYEDAVVQCSASETCLGFWQRYGGNEYGLLHKDGSRTWRAGLPNGSVTEVWVQSEDCGISPEVPETPETATPTSDPTPSPTSAPTSSPTHHPSSTPSSCSYSPGEIQNAEYVDFSITSYEDAVVQCSASDTCLGFLAKVWGERVWAPTQGR